MTNEDSFKDVEGFYVEGNRYSPRSLKYLVANKNDLDEERTVTIEQGEVKLILYYCNIDFNNY